MLREQIKKHGYVLTDGAMGTYYYEMTAGQGGSVELANLGHPNIIKKIHEQYIEAGATLIRTNSFNGNRRVLNVSVKVQESLLKEAYHIAKEAIGNSDVEIFASIGPIPDDGDEEGQVFNEYKEIIDVFIKEGAQNFLFETFSQSLHLKELSEYIKKKVAGATVMTQFAVDATGHTKQGVPVSKLLREIQKIDTIDYYGLNCGTGPMHMNRIIRELLKKGIEVQSALPNAGYPHIVDERTVYPGNPLYFSELMADMKSLGVSIIGGCCGTTPAHTKSIKEALRQFVNEKASVHIDIEENKVRKPRIKESKENTILHKMSGDAPVIMVELDPPYGINIDKIMDGARVLKECGTDMITIADSPLGRPRADAATIGAKIKREIGIDVMPHLCCRDKNVIGLKSKILGSHIDGIRHILAVTGDPVPSANRGEIKGVFNLNSFKLMEMIKEINEELLDEEPIITAGALDLNAGDIDKLMKRTLKKKRAGAQFFLTQPIYDAYSIQRLKKIKDETDLHILAGIMPLVSLRNALYLNNEVPGILIPEVDINRFSKNMSREEAEVVGVDMAVNLCRELRDIADGFYFMAPFNRASMIKDIITQIK